MCALHLLKNGAINLTFELMNYFKLFLIYTVFLVLIIPRSIISQNHSVPGTVIDYSSAETGVYLGSPSLAILHDGTYVVSIDPFGAKIRKSGQPRNAKIFVSKDRGENWKFVTEVEDSFWSGLFTWKQELYLIGPTGLYGDLAIRKSSDGGKTWTVPLDKESGLLRMDQEYHSAPVPIVVHNGRIWRAIEDRNPPNEWGKNFRALVISAPVDSDLLKASSWTTSNRLSFHQEKWEGYAWLEGNIVVTPENRLVNILRADFRPKKKYGKAAKVHISEYGDKLTFNHETGFIDFPGGSKKFTIRYDGVSEKYWSLVNYIPDEYADFSDVRPDQVRNTLALVSSNNLQTWKIEKIIFQHPDVINVGFQYADWVFEGSDIISVIRTAYPDHEGVDAHNAHDSNYIIFYRIKDFRDIANGL